ncbi:MAG: hypothetical protein IPF79_04545 [Ignavibacteria bacterium]|nr:hypothetical protein [Ignavibacteria bacterium]
MYDELAEANRKQATAQMVLDAAEKEYKTLTTVTRNGKQEIVKLSDEREKAWQDYLATLRRGARRMLRWGS